MILVTGGTGLVGSHLLYYLCNAGEEVRAIKRVSSDISILKKVFSYYNSDVETLLKKITWVEADLLDVYSLEEAMKDITQVYHCAAIVSFEKKKIGEMMRINADGTANIVNAALAQNVSKFLHVSSIATIGNGSVKSPATEDSFAELSSENSNYSFSKYDAEREVWRGAEEGLNIVIVNPSVIIGGGNWQQSSSNMFSKARKGIRFYTEGATGFVDVRDVAQLMILLMNSDVSQERFILNGTNTTYRHFFDLIHSAFKIPKPNIKAGKLLSEFAWRAETARCFLSNTSPLITKETAISAHTISAYSNQKVKNLFPKYEFKTLEKSITDFCGYFEKDTH